MNDKGKGIIFSYSLILFFLFVCFNRGSTLKDFSLTNLGQVLVMLKLSTCFIVSFNEALTYENVSTLTPVVMR